MSIDLGIRGGVIAMSLLCAGVALRDHRHHTFAYIAAALWLGAAASVTCSAPNFPRPFEWWQQPLLMVASATSVVFWLWARAAFDDDFELRPWHGVLWAVIAGMQLYTAGSWMRRPALVLALDRMLSLSALCLALLAVAQMLATWREDLVARRRRSRIFVLAGFCRETPKFGWIVSVPQ